MRVIGAGFLTADIILQCDSTKGLRPVPPSYGAGGTVGNIVTYLSALKSADCSILAGVGSDALAEVVRRELNYFGVDTRGVHTSASTFTRRITHLVTVDGSKRGVHEFLMTCPACGQEFPPFPVPRFRDYEDWVKSNVSPQTVLIVDRANEFTAALAQAVVSAGGSVVFEPGYVSRSRDLVEQLLRIAKIVKYSAELRWGEKLFSQQLASSGIRPPLIMETRGGKGVIVRRGNKETKLTTEPLPDVVDAGGAGDAFMAGFLSGIGLGKVAAVERIEDNILEAAVQRAQALGALACLFIGSKGLLFAKAREDIESAIDQTVAKRRIPKDFYFDRVCRGLPDYTLPAEPGVCPTCRLPEAT